MDHVSIVPAVFAVAAALWATIAAYRMGAWLQAHGVKVSWLWYRLTVPWYVARYRRLTSEKDGKPGPLFAQFIVAINLALVFAVATIVLLVIERR